MHYPPNHERRRGYSKLVYCIDETYELFDLANQWRQWSFLYKMQAAIDLARYLAGKTRFINSCPTDSQAEKAAKFVIILGLMLHTESLSSTWRRSLD